MKIVVNAISPEGIDLEEELDPSELDLETEQLHYDRKIHITAHVERDNDIVNVSCNISGMNKQVCSRCLSEFDSQIDKKANFVYKLTGEYTIELDNNIRDTIVLDYPIRALCKPNCKGLCFQCGNNLNEGPCGCKRN